MTQQSIFSMTAFHHPDLNLTEQQEAVLDAMYQNASAHEGWFIAYDLHRLSGYSKTSSKRVVIGDAGRRMRELRKMGKLESRKRGRFEEYQIITDHHQ